MSEKRNVPAIRFAGFTDAWEQRKVGAIASFAKGTGYSKADICKSGTPLILYGRLYTKYETVIHEVDTYAVPRAGSVYSRGGEVIVPASGETAEDISIASVVEKAGILLGGDLNIIIPDEAVDPTFLALTLSHGKAHNELSKLAQGKSVVHIHNTDIQSVEIQFPSIAEQVVLSNLFVRIDTLITLHQRKYDQLIRVKKAMLEKMFPKGDARVPEIRFSGFTDAWEQRKLGDLAIFNPQSELPESFEYVDLESVVGTEMLSHRTETRRTAPSRAQRLARTGDLFYQTVRPYQKNNYLFEKPDDNYVFSTGYAQLRPAMDGYFLLCLVQNESFVKVVLENCTGTSYPAISSNDLAQIDVFAPQKPLEQRSIGDFFRGVDTLITLHQRQLEKLKKIKAAMLERMFV